MVKVYIEFAIINVNSISDKNGPRMFLEISIIFNEMERISIYIYIGVWVYLRNDVFSLFTFYISIYGLSCTHCKRISFSLPVCTNNRIRPIIELYLSSKSINQISLFVLSIFFLLSYCYVKLMLNIFITNESRNSWIKIYNFISLNLKYIFLEYSLCINRNTFNESDWFLRYMYGHF